MHKKRSLKKVEQPTLKVFQTFEGVLQRYSLGALKLHELVWVKANSPADVHQSSPLEVRVQSTGHNTLIYDSGVNESWPTPVFNSASPDGLTKVNANGVEPIFACVPQLHRMSSNTFYLRTTPGRLILNSVIYENLFL